ncbi:MAG: hypothetical protein IPP25_20925 [Saprospiraceae bacterium]|nr:hypothetical protein [Candidatus Opimibacter skivensis]
MKFRSLIFILLCTSFASTGFSQFYQVFGPQDVDLCSGEISHYGIETSAQLTRTTWTLIPDGGATIFGDVYFADIQFFIPGTYILVTSSTSVDGLILSDSLTLFVYGNPYVPEVLGCYVQADSGGGCYQVCAFHRLQYYIPEVSSSIQ